MGNGSPSGRDGTMEGGITMKLFILTAAAVVVGGMYHEGWIGFWAALAGVGAALVAAVITLNVKGWFE